MKATCNVIYPILKGIFDVGDVVEIEPILSTKREVLSSKRVYSTGIDTRGVEYKKMTWVDDVVREKGSYLDYRIKSKNGHYYTGHCIYCLIGNKTLSEIFK